MDKESVRLRFPCPCSMLLAISEAGKYRYLYCHPAQWLMLENRAKAVLGDVWEHAHPVV